MSEPDDLVATVSNAAWRIGEHPRRPPARRAPPGTSPPGEGRAVQLRGGVPWQR
ncbi:MAG: hypothetical protein ACRDSL_12750 [Pseudonocardiaceae bacterium]